MSTSSDDHAVRNFRDACYFFEQTSLDSAANDFADHSTHNLPLDDPKAMRNLASRIVKTELSKHAPNIKDMTVQDVLEDITATSTVINLNVDERPIRTITINDALDIIERALDAKYDLIAQERGSVSIIRNPTELPIVIPPSCAPGAEEAYDDALITAKNLRKARQSLRQQGEGWTDPTPSKEHHKKVALAEKFREKDTSQIRWLADILAAAKDELCAHAAPDKKMRVLSDLIDVVIHEFEQNVMPAIEKLPPAKKRGR